jgi:RNA polymerase sigma factor (sigma-70 family)
MAVTLTSETFIKLLGSLDSDPERAGEKYEDLRRTLTRFFEWRGAPFPEEQTDEVFNRVARKLVERTEIRNFGGYCYEVARLVSLEALKGIDSKRASFEESHHDAVFPDTADEVHERELRLSCLDDCLDSLCGESRELIITYYQDEKGNHIGRRKALADRLGLKREALANRAQRVRGKLEQCVKRCVGRKVSI